MYGIWNWLSLLFDNSETFFLHESLIIQKWPPIERNFPGDISFHVKIGRLSRRSCIQCNFLLTNHDTITRRLQGYALNSFHTFTWSNVQTFYREKLHWPYFTFFISEFAPLLSNYEILSMSTFGILIFLFNSNYSLKV